MKKKIVISYAANAVVGSAFDYTIQKDGFNIIYPNGQSHVTFNYKLTPIGPGVVIRPTLSETIDATINYLVTNYSHAGITYTRVNDTIEVDIDIDGFITVFYGNINASITFSVQDITSVITYKLKYFLQYKNIVGDEFRCDILKKDYTGTETEIHGTAIVEKADVTNHLDPIRGGGLSLKLEASKDLTLEDLYSEGENDFQVKFSRNGKLMFFGFLNPDGVFQDYVRDEWIITLDCVDGLGALKNLSFVQDNGLHFVGKHLAMEIIYQCLKRTGTLMPINTSVNILYEGLDAGDDIFNKIYLNTDRFVRTDNDTIMSCEEVLKSILDIFKACVTQIDGEWFIYKPNEIYLDAYVDFKQFDINNVFLGINKINLNKTLGSQIDNFYPHHCTGNQKIEIKGSTGGFRLNYKYGFVAGLLENPNLIKNGDILDYDGWEIIDPSRLTNSPTLDNGFLFKHIVTNNTLIPAVRNTPGIPVLTGQQMSFTISFETSSPGYGPILILELKQGTKYLVDNAINMSYALEEVMNHAQWQTDPGGKLRFHLPPSNGTFTLTMPPFVEDGDLTIGIINISSPGGIVVTTLIKSIEIQTVQSSDAAQGEFHTVERANRVSSIVKENQTVFNGDNASVIYNGAIFDENLDPTTSWSRVNVIENYPLLRIAAEEELRIAQRPTKIFRGDFYGYIPYLSLININNVGKFMPIEWSYDTMTNVTSAKHLELFAAEVSDIVYKYTLDYGETVKPTIK